jgi:hypothetical protein
VVPSCKGILSHWAHLAARAAFRKGIVSYCGHRNPVEPGTWAGGIVGLKSILGVKKREQALDILQQLSDLGYLSFELDTKTKLLTYRVTDYELDYCGAPCDSGAVYTTPGYGFLCVPRSITERLTAQYYIFNEADACFPCPFFREAVVFPVISPQLPEISSHAGIITAFAASSWLSS